MRSSTKFRGLRLLTFFALVMPACAIAVAENGNEDSGKKEILTTLEQRMQKTISVEFRGESIDNVISMMAKYADIDIIKSPEVEAEVTATLTDVPLEEALNNILAAHGYGYITSKNLIRIVPLKEITERVERLVTRIYRITYADIAEVEAALKKFISKGGSLSSNPGTSNIIVTDTESRIKAIDTFIAEIDRITPQILVEVRIYDITTDEDFDLDIPWDVARNTPITTIDIDEVTTTSTGVKTTDTTTKETKTVWRDNGTTYRKSKPFIGGSYDETEGGSIRFGLLNDVIDIDFVLSILHEQDYAKLLANPRIMVLDNEKATFEIIREIPYTEVSTTGNTATETIKFKEVGVKLEVTPHVTREGMLRLHIIPEFGVHIGTTDPPAVNTRKMDTIALVKDNQTVVLGGLRKRETTQDVWKVPIFGDIPLLGGLFRSKTESIETNELLIFITPRIIVEPTLSPRELEQLEQTEVPPPKDPTLTLDSIKRNNE